MRDNTLQPIVIMALNLASEEKEKEILTDFLGKPFTRPALDGCYKGQTERSYIVPVEDNLNDILDLAKTYYQESILYLDNQRIATLYYTNGDVVVLGEFKNVHKNTALKQDAYTYNPETDGYYIVE